MTNIREVARVSGLSTATVSRALKNPEIVAEATRERVLKAVKEVNYRPNMLARNFRSERSFALLVLVPGISNPFFSKVLQGIENAAQERGYSVLIGDTRDNPQREDQYLNLISSRLADGLIQLSPDYVDGDGNPRHFDFPVVHACGCELTPAPSVRIDNRGAARELVEHLIGKGHRRIAVISGPEGNPHAIDRVAGYREALEAAGITFDPSLLRNGKFTMASGAEAAASLLTLAELPTAIFSINDEMAIGAIQALSQHGLKIPEDMAVVGFDDIDFAAHSYPPLTTVRQPAEEMGAKACEVLIDQIERNDEHNSVQVLQHLVVLRESA